MELLAGLLGGLDLGMDGFTPEEMAWAQGSALLAMKLTFHVAADVKMRVITSLASSDDLIYIILLAYMEGFSLEQIGAWLTQLLRLLPDDDSVVEFCEYVGNGGRHSEIESTSHSHIDYPVAE